MKIADTGNYLHTTIETHDVLPRAIGREFDTFQLVEIFYASFLHRLYFHDKLAAKALVEAINSVVLTPGEASEGDAEGGGEADYGPQDVDCAF